MPVQLLPDRTRSVADPIRNFKFQVEVYHSNPEINSAFSGGPSLATFGFTSIEGLAMTTEMVPYREGGWNTNPHKLPGMTDFAPLTAQAGVFAGKPGMWNLAKQMFSVQWGGGTIGLGEEFRFDLGIRVLDHPVTRGAASGVQGVPDGAVLAYKVYNAWVGSVAFGNLNAMDNQVLIHNMTIHHEGFDTFYGNNDATTFTHST